MEDNASSDIGCDYTGTLQRCHVPSIPPHVSRSANHVSVNHTPHGDMQQRHVSAHFATCHHPETPHVRKFSEPHVKQQNKKCCPREWKLGLSHKNTSARPFQCLLILITTNINYIQNNYNHSPPLQPRFNRQFLYSNDIKISIVICRINRLYCSFRITNCFSETEHDDFNF